MTETECKKPQDLFADKRPHQLHQFKTLDDMRAAGHTMSATEVKYFRTHSPGEGYYLAVFDVDMK